MSIWQQIGNARAMGGARFTPLETFTGDAVVAVVNFYAFKTRDHGPALCMEGLVVEANGNAPVGQMVSKAFYIARAKFPEYEQADAKALASAMLNTSDPQFIATECEKLTSNPAGQGARGVLVRATMTPRQDKKNPAKTFVDIAWVPVPAGPEQIQQVRARLEGGLVPPTALTLPDTTCVLSAAPVQAPPVQAWAPQQQPAPMAAPQVQPFGAQPYAAPQVQQTAAAPVGQPSILGGILGGK